jgi:DNA-binding LacI/PurR family transcriptional regulator
MNSLQTADQVSAPTIADVARAAGVSATTVSRVLNGQAKAIRISKGTADRVLQAAAQLRYFPNASARSLRTTLTKTIGMVGPFNPEMVLNPWVAEVEQAVQIACQTRGYHVLLGYAEPSGESWEQSGMVAAGRVDGVLLFGDVRTAAEHREARDRPAARIRPHCHAVYVAGRPVVEGAFSVTVDYRQAMYSLLDHLLALGHRVFASISSDQRPETWVAHERHQALSQFLFGHGLSYPSMNHASIKEDVEAARRALELMRAQPDAPTAIFVEYDRLAITVLRAAHLSGIRVPDDVSIVGFDDIAFASLVTPSLTTVHQPIKEMGHVATMALIDMIEGITSPDSPLASGSHVILPATLVCRESSGPPAKSKEG